MTDITQIANNDGGLEIRGKINDIIISRNENETFLNKGIESFHQYKIKNGDKIDLLYGKNTGYYINSVGGLTLSASSEYSEYIYVRPSSNYKYVGKLIGNVLYIAYYDEDYEFISADSDSGTLLEFSFTTPSNCKYIRYSTFDYSTAKCYVTYEGSEEYKNENKDVKINRIEISNTIDDLTARPVIYSSIQSAMDSITDNSEFNRYQLELLDGTHDAESILLMDYVDIIRSEKAVLDEVFIKHDFLNTQPVGDRDLFKTNSDPYTAATEDFPLHVNFKDIVFKGANINYCIHSDFNKNPNFEITFTNCKLNNNDASTDVGASDYAAGIGIYGGQQITFNNCELNGRKVPIVDLPQYHQSSGFVVHNRADQNTPCNVTFNNCDFTGGYGGRVVDFGSGQNDTININGGTMSGTWGSLLMFNDTGVTTQSITVSCTAQINRLQPQQEVSTGNRLLSKIKVVSAKTEVHKASEAVEIGDIIIYSNKFGEGVNKTISANSNLQILGVACGDASIGDYVTIVKKGLVSVKCDTDVSENVELTVSDVNDGSFKIAGVNDKVFAVTVNDSTDTDNDEFNPGLVMINLL